MIIQRTYFVGNSVTDTIHRAGSVDLAASQGHTQIWGHHMILGAPLSVDTGGIFRQSVGLLPAWIG